MYGFFWFCESVSGPWASELVHQRARYIRHKHKSYNQFTHSLLLVLPSGPRNVTITFVNQSAVEIRWLPPEVTGDQTHLYYEVSCRKQCSRNQKCLEEYCERDVNYIPNKEGLNKTQVIVADLSPFGIYSFKIYAKNRVSEVAKRRHRIEESFIEIYVRTNGSSELHQESVTTEFEILFLLCPSLVSLPLYLTLNYSTS